MHRLVRSSITVTAALAALAGTSAFVPSATQAALSRKWTKISTNTGLGIASAGLLRTADGKLHVVWPRNDGANGFSLHYSTVGGQAKLLATGTIISKWSAVTTYPRLVSVPGGGIRLVFTGANGQGGSPFNLDTMYTATSNSAGKTWSLFNGSMSQSKLVPLTDDAATTRGNGTPVAAWSGGAQVSYHVGTSTSTPASTPDNSVPIGAGGVVVGPALVRAKNGAVSVAWFNGSGKSSQGYWVDQILPSQKAKVKAPHSGGGSLADNQPLQAVAFAARTGSGGAYLAYCVPSKTVPCTHIALWKAGSRTARTVPGSKNASHVAIAAGPKGHLWILWYSSASNKIRLVRTNASATGFGKVLTIAAPPKIALFQGLQAEGSRGPLDIVALVQQTTAGTTPAYFDTQLKA